MSQHLTAFGDMLYFQATGAIGGQELWRLDKNGQVSMIELRPGPIGSLPDWFTVFQDELYFSAGNFPSTLWKVTAEGDVVLVNETPPPDWFGPRNLVVFGDELYMTASTPASGHELWKMNASGALMQVADIYPGSESGITFSFEAGHAIVAVLENALYFTADDGVHGVELWRVTAGGVVQLVGDIYPGPGHSAPDGYTAFNGGLYFAASGGRERGERELWRVVPPANASPIVESPIPNQPASADEFFSFTFSDGAFSDSDVQDSFTYAATQADGSPLPEWLSFFAASRTFQGVPEQHHAGVLRVKVSSVRFGRRVSPRHIRHRGRSHTGPITPLAKHDRTARR